MREFILDYHLTLCYGTGSRNTVAVCRTRVTEWAHNSDSNTKNDMRIGEVAAEAGVSIQTLRYYERRDCCRLPRDSCRATGGTIQPSFSAYGSFDALRIWDSRSKRSPTC
jgi:hypothetical protein